MAITLSNIRMGQLDPVKNMRNIDGPPLVAMFADAVFDNSYATGGELLSPTLDGYFSDVTQVYFSDNQGVALEFVDNASLALAKIKAYRAEGAHTHTVTVVGGGALASTHPVVVTTDGGGTEVLEKSKTKTVAGSQTGQASYTTGGQTLDLSADFDAIPRVMCSPVAVGDFIARYVPGTNASDGKIALIVPSTGVEVANTTNVSAQTIAYIAHGQCANTTDEPIASSSDAANTADEVAAAQDLSAITFHIMIVGKPRVSA